MTTVSATQSILETLKQLLAENLDLCREWQNMLSSLGICPDVRNLSDEWFCRCHQFCEGRAEKSETGIAQDNMTEVELFNELLQHVHEQMNSTPDPIKKWNLKDQLSKLQSFNPAEWIVKAYRCVVEEINLTVKYRKLNADSTYKETQKPFEVLYLKLQEKKRVLGETLEMLEREGQNLKQAKESHQETLYRAQQLQHFIDVQGTPVNGTESGIQQARKLIQEKEENLKQKIHSFKSIIMNLKENLGEIYENARELIENLLYEVKQWKHAFKLIYAELAGNVDLDRFAPCCARTGELLRDLLRSDMIRLENVINDVSGDGKSECDTLMSKFDDLLARFYQSKERHEKPGTFLVTKQDGNPKQDPWNIKKSLARTPKITLRILGADTLDALGGVEVHACFLLESVVNEHYNCDEGVLNFDAMESDSWRIKNSKLPKFVQQRSYNSDQQRIHEVTFSIELDVNLNRSKNLNVYKEKYRLMFWTQLDNKKYWTMSLPMVVTTGGNQNCQCLASVMWQCFSTDVFTIPTEPLPTMPWSKVAEMLQAKIQTLPSNRTLTEDNINHLKERLLDSADVTDDTEVSLEKFCSTPLRQEVPANETEEKKEEFTFWMWYLSIYNLIKTDLIEFWKNGWIEGFLSKDTAVRKLTESKTYKPGTLLLRFSDQQIDKTQSKDSVYGKLATSLLIKNNDQCRPVVRHVDTIGHDKLAVMHLADILLQTVNNAGQNVYRYLYPKPDIHCKILFQGCQRKAEVAGHGYVGVKKVFKADLEQLDENFSKLDLGGKRRLSTCRDSGNRKNNPEELQDLDEMANSEVKRLKSNKTNHFPLLHPNSDDLDDISAIVDEVGNTEKVETGIGNLNMIGGKTDIATETNLAQDRNREIGHETDMVFENAQQTAALQGYQKQNTGGSPVLRKLLTEQLHATDSNASKVIPQSKNHNFIYTENSEQFENGSIKYTESGINEHKGNNLATQNIHNRFLIDNNFPMAQITPCQSQTIPYQWTLNNSEKDQFNSESIQNSTISFRVSENSEKSRTLGATVQNPDTLHEIQPFRATIGDDQSIALSDEIFMEHSAQQSIEPNNLFEANHIATSTLDDNQLVTDPSMGLRSDENPSGYQLLDSLSGENLLPGGKETFCQEFGRTQAQSANNQVVLQTDLPNVHSDEEMMEWIQEYLKYLPPEKAIDALKPFLESLAPHFMLEIITLYLKTLKPELNQMVIQALQNSKEESQTLKTPNQIEEDEAAAGLEQAGLTTAEIADGLSVAESDILPNLDDINDFLSQLEG